MKVSFFPKTKLGSLSVVLFVVLVILVAYFFVMVNVFDQRGGATFFSNINLTIPMLAAWASGLASLVLGTIAVIKSKSRAILVFIVIVLTFLTTVYGVVAFGFPG
jgi:hypothetical protein